MNEDIDPSGSFIVPGEVVAIDVTAFANCELLQTIILSQGMRSIGSRAFIYCHNLEDFTLPQGITLLDNSAFFNCISLKNITLPPGIMSINNTTFAFCERLQTIILPPNITSIGSLAFLNCISLQSITLPQSITSISKDAFADCKSLNHVFIDTDNKDHYQRVLALVPQELIAKVVPFAVICDAKKILNAQLKRFKRMPEINPLYRVSHKKDYERINLPVEILGHMNSWVLQESRVYQKISQKLHAEPLPTNADELVQYRQRLEVISNEILDTIYSFNTLPEPQYTPTIESPPQCLGKRTRQASECLISGGLFAVPAPRNAEDNEAAEALMALTNMP